MGGFGSPAAISAATTGLQMVSQNNQAKAQAQAQTNQINQQNQMMALQQEQRARQQRDLLKRQAATARASLAAGGGGVAGGGSAAALLSGLTKQTEQGIADNYDALALRAEANNPTKVNDPAGDILNGWNKAQQVWGAMKPLLF
ncbi:hypothetical protein [Magnetospirillum sp. 64-120]|uniref:hypothetical protein n=1 Tax=Magnetospirillum sp. 64-120 TaxID=1895778 RepID=UPI00092A4B3E|nr:hypothetical protein [Magnetospirillum sp. 64-120]OJX65807.1 MAG: hypothetical protein BGO92_06835 [Magnetospirillum sp. 64-120]